MSKPILIPTGSILNCFLPPKKGNLKRIIMNAEAQLLHNKMGGELLNHTAVIEKSGANILIWEASVIRGVCPTELTLYTPDCVFIITRPNMESDLKLGLERLKSQSGKRYDFKSWFTYLRFFITNRWKGETTEGKYSEQWFCSELVDWAYDLSNESYKATPNHVYERTKQNELWRGNYAQLRSAISKGEILIR